MVATYLWLLGWIDELLSSPKIFPSPYMFTVFGIVFVADASRLTLGAFMEYVNVDVIEAMVGGTTISTSRLSHTSRSILLWNLLCTFYWLDLLPHLLPSKYSFIYHLNCPVLVGNNKQSDLRSFTFISHWWSYRSEYLRKYEILWFKHG